MRLVSRACLFTALPFLTYEFVAGIISQKYLVALTLVALVWLGQFLGARARRWVLIPVVAATLAILMSYLISEDLISVATWQQWLNWLPGEWTIYQARPPILMLSVVLGLSINALMLARLGLGSPILLLIIAICCAMLTYQTLTPPSHYTTSVMDVSIPILSALWLIGGAQLWSLCPVLLRYWRRVLPPLAVGGLIMLAILVSWTQQRQSDDNRVFDLIAEDGNRIATRLTSETQSHLRAMRRFTSFWSMIGHTPTLSEWESQAERYYSDFGYFRNIAFIDLKGNITRVYPLRSNRGVLGVNLYDSDSVAKEVLDLPLIYGIEGQSGIVDFLLGGRGVLSYLPVRNAVDGTLLGAVGMVVSIDSLLNSLLDQTYSHDRTVMLMGETDLYFRSGPLGHLADWRSDHAVTLGSEKLTLSVQPSFSLLLKLRERLPEITLVFGTLLAYLIYIVLYIYRRLAQQNALASAGNDSLREEIDKRERLQQEVEWLAKHDDLTQLPNRRHLLTWMQSHQENIPLTLMVCDLDHFKRINDHFGHLTGDRYLRILAQRCREPIELAGGIFARYGGEEFVACIPTCGKVRAQRLADEMRSAALSENLTQADGTPVTLSIGVVVAERATADREQMFQLADEALYRAKQAGRNRVLMSSASP